MEFGKRQNPTRRLYGIAGVVLFHVLLVYGLVSGLARKAMEVLPPPIETKILKEEKPPEPPPPPPPPPPKIEIPPPPFIPPPEIKIETPPPPPPQPTITTQSVKPTPPAPPAPPVVAPPAPPAPVRSVTKAPVVKANACKKPEYPAVSQRLGESGAVELELLVGVDGRVTDSRITRSSGHDRLDKAAQAGLSKCKFEPGSVDGKPVPAWAQLRYRFSPEE